MYEKYKELIFTIIICGTFIFLNRECDHDAPPVTVSINIVSPEAVREDVVEIETVSSNVIVPEVVEDISSISITPEEAREITLIATAEAGNQSELGIRLVIDTVLNRVEDPVWPNDIHSVIFQPNQFYTAGMGATKFRDDILIMVYEEAEKRTDTKVKFFARSWPRSGTRYLHEGDHYFNK